MLSLKIFSQLIKLISQANLWRKQKTRQHERKCSHAQKVCLNNILVRLSQNLHHFLYIPFKMVSVPYMHYNLLTKDVTQILPAQQWQPVKVIFHSMPGHKYKQSIQKRYLYSEVLIKWLYALKRNSPWHQYVLLISSNP